MRSVPCGASAASTLRPHALHTWLASTSKRSSRRSAASTARCVALAAGRASSACCAAHAAADADSSACGGRASRPGASTRDSDHTSCTARRSMGLGGGGDAPWEAMDTGADDDADADADAGAGDDAATSSARPAVSAPHAAGRHGSAWYSCNDAAAQHTMEHAWRVKQGAEEPRGTLAGRPLTPAAGDAHAGAASTSAARPSHASSHGCGGRASRTAKAQRETARACGGAKGNC